MSEFQSQHHVFETGYTRLVQQRPELLENVSNYQPEVNASLSGPSRVGGTAMQETVENPTKNSENSHGAAQTTS